MMGDAAHVLGREDAINDREANGRSRFGTRSIVGGVWQASMLLWSVATILMTGCVPSREANLNAADLPMGLRVVTPSGGMNYRVYVPPGYRAGAPMPTIVFLHGWGEQGTDNLAQMRVGLYTWMQAEPARWPFIGVFPQKESMWTPWIEQDAQVMAVLDDASRRWSVDPQRVYLMGISQGGMGAWRIAAAHPERFAAIVPMAAPGDAEQAEIVRSSMKGVAVWAIHGENDQFVGTDQGEVMVQAARAVGTDVRWTLVPGVAHNCWDKALDEYDIGAWLLTHSKAKP